MRSCRAIVITLALFLFLPSICRAQALADKIPADAIVYFGWKGTDTLGADFDQSHLKAVSNASEIRQVFTVAIPALVAHLGQMNGGGPSPQAVQETLDTLKILWTRPTAVYFSDSDPSKPEGIKLAILCDAGANAEIVSQRVTQLISAAGPAMGVQVRAKVSGSMVIVSTFDYPDAVDKPLSGDADFQRVLAPLTKDPVATFYVDDTAALKLGEQLLRQNGPPELQHFIPLIKQSTGIEGLKHIAVTEGFESRNWVTQAFVDAPAPRQGLLALGESQPLADELFKLIPETAARFGAGELDLNAAYDFIQLAVETFSGDGGAEFHQTMAQANQMLGIDVQKDLLAAFGNQWAWYVDPTAAGFGGMGGTLVNRARDAVKLEMSLDHVEAACNNLLKQSTGERFDLEFRHEVVDGVRLHFLAVPFISPSWAVKDGTFYFGLYPQAVAAALDRPADAKSILTDPTFIKVRAELGAPAKVTSLSYDNLPQTAQGGYQTLLVLSQVYLGIGDLMGAQFPALIIPPLDRLMSELEPGGQAAWTDDAGWHVKEVTPFPGAEVLGSLSFGNLAVGESAVAISVLLPSLNKARGTANVVKSANNLRQIGLAITLYAGDNKGKFPADLGTLVKTEDITAQVFISPSDNLAVPDGLTDDQKIAWVNANSDYVYVGAGLTNNVDASRIIAYEKNDFFNNGRNILYGDDHVEFVQEPMAQAAIDAIPKGAGK